MPTKIATLGFTVALSALTASSGVAHAGFYDSLPKQSIENIQDYLIWTGHFDGVVDGKADTTLEQAIAGWQAASQLKSDGLLDVEEARILNKHAREAYEKSKFTVGRDGSAGLSYGLPYAFVEPRGQNEWNGLNFAAPDETVRLTSFRLSGMDHDSMVAFAESAFSDVPGYSVTDVEVNGDRIDLVGGDSTETLHMSALLFGGQLRGYFVWIDHDRLDEVGPSLVATRNSLGLSPVESDGLMARADENDTPLLDEASPSDADEDVLVRPIPNGSGTSFAVDNTGHFVTNSHVVAGCRSVEVTPYGEAEVIYNDESRDLALLKVEGAVGSATATIATDDPMLAEDVYAFGYPLPQALGTELGFSRGSVSSTVGLRSDPDQFRMTAQVQPGNSGGPLLDAGGRVIGVVTAKLDAMAIASATGDIPQNMNFAIKSQTLRAFLDDADIDFARSDRTEAEAAAPHVIAQSAANYTAQVLCYPQ